MAARIQQLRAAAGLTQAALALAVGVPITTVQAWEQARRVPRLQAAVKLARVLGTTVETLAGDLGQGEKPPRRRQKGK
jgi:DNA-binding XRE family transcriptional regulator